jgi:tyrosine-specific transport protein
MIGGVVGVGVFGLPYAFAQSGWGLGFLILLILGFLLLLLNLMYSEVVVQTSGRHRLVGYVKKYFGLSWSRIVAGLFILLAWGAMLAYMMVGGNFLTMLFSPFIQIPPLVFQLAIAAIVAVMTFGGIRKLAKIEVAVIGALLFLFTFMILSAFPSLEWRNVSTIHWSGWFAPYGVIFFALSGLGVIPEMKDILGSRAKELPHAVIIGQAVIILLYALFTLAVVGVTGSLTTEVAFDGLASMFGRTFSLAGSLLGAVTVISIFSIVSVEMQDVWRFDFGVSRRLAWGLASGVPVFLLILGFNRFVDLIGFLGAVFGGLMGIFVVIMYEKMRQSGACEIHHCLKIPSIAAWLLVAIFAGGIIQTIFALFF